MDPLGARPTVVPSNEVPRWTKEMTATDPLSSGPSLYGPEAELPRVHKTPPFDIREDLNDKVALWTGDITKLSLEAIVHPTNESLTDKNPISTSILEAAGPDLKEELKTQVVSCRTGDAKITIAYSLPSRNVIHTVGPRYNVKYKTAAESALYNCYRSVLQISKNREITTLAIPTLVSCRRNYPAVDGAHIALRTVRRFLEHYSDSFDLVVFVSPEPDFVYSELFKIYFPRTPEEEQLSMNVLPLDLGNEFGEPVIEERQIRISEQPFMKKNNVANDLDKDSEEETVNSNEDDELVSQEVGSHPFSMMVTDKDHERREALMKQRAAMSEEEDRSRRYKQFLSMARTENFSEFVALNAFYRAGTDYSGRQIMVYVGRNFPAPKFDMNKAVAYFISLMDPVVRREYVFVYFHAESDPDNQFDGNFLKELFSLLDERYKHNLKNFYIVHTNFWFKMSTWWFLTWTGSEIKEKVVNLSGVEYLYDVMAPKEIEIPSFVMEFDRKVNGTNYYKPVRQVSAQPAPDEL